MNSSNIVLVGVDGSAESGAALAYAVAEANRRGARLRVVSTYFPEYSVHGRTQPVTASEGAIEVDLEKETRRMVEDALAGDSPSIPSARKASCPASLVHGTIYDPSSTRTVARSTCDCDAPTDLVFAANAEDQLARSAIEAYSDSPRGRTTITGQRACCTHCKPTEPSSMLAKPPRPR